MAGPGRISKEASSSKKPYSRVRFAETTSTAFDPRTPMRKRTSTIVDVDGQTVGMKRRRREAARRRSAEHVSNVYNVTTCQNSINHTYGIFPDDEKDRDEILEFRRSLAEQMSQDEPKPSQSSSSEYYLAMAEAFDEEKFPATPSLHEMQLASLRDELLQSRRRHQELETENTKLKSQIQRMQIRFGVIGGMIERSCGLQARIEWERVRNEDLGDGDDSSFSAAVGTGSFPSLVRAISISAPSSPIRPPPVPGPTSAYTSASPSASRRSGPSKRVIDEGYDRGYCPAAKRNDVDMSIDEEVNLVVNTMVNGWKLEDGPVSAPAKLGDNFKSLGESSKCIF